MAAGTDLSRSRLTRRGLLGAAGGAAGALALAACSDERPPGKPSDAALAKAGYTETKIPYAGDNINQFGYFAAPEGTARRLVVLIHGGYWQDQYRQDLMTPLAADLVSAGCATWNIEYRRVGSGGDFPATFEDVATAIEHTAKLPGMKGVPLTVVGHSAGGQLAAWAASRTNSTPGGAPRVVAEQTVSLSGVLDLTTAANDGLGGNAAQSLMGGGPSDKRAEYALADPSLLLPARGQLLAVHAQDDGIVPPSQSRSYVAADLTAGGKAELLMVPGDHFDLIAPTSEAWTTARGRILG